MFRKLVRAISIIRPTPPPRITAEQVGSFALAGGKVILGGIESALGSVTSSTSSGSGLDSASSGISRRERWR
jgi:hypothetical protein